MPDAGGEALDVDGDVAPRRVLEVLRQAAEPQRHVLHGDVGGLEPVEHHEPVPAAGVAVVDVQRRRLQPRAPARHRQHHRLAGRVAERAGQGQVAQEAVGAGLEVALQPQHRAGDVERRDPHAAAGLADAADPHPALAGEEVAEVGRHQRRDRAGEVDVEAEARVARAQRDQPVGDAVRSASSAKRTSTPSSGPEPLERQVDRRRILDPEQRREYPALRLVQVEIDVELPGLVGEAGAQRQLAAGAVEAAHVEVGREHAAREVERAADRDGRRASEHRLGEGDARQLELGQIDRDRKLGQRERPGFGVGQSRGRGRRVGTPRPGDPLGAQPVDVDAAAQQREPAPVELDVVDLEPAAARVGNGDLGDPRLARQRARDAVQPDLPRRRRQPPLEQVEQEAVAALGLGASCASAAIATSASRPMIAASRLKTPVRCRCRAPRSRPRRAASPASRGRRAARRCGCRSARRRRRRPGSPNRRSGCRSR